MKLLKKYRDQKEQIISLLEEKGLFEELDESLIDHLCFQNFIADNAAKDISKRGNLVETVSYREKVLKPNPSLRIYNNAIDKIAIYATKLGITPQERQKLGLADLREEEDELAEFD